ncbi:hypothetical protein BpHYR1_035552 [Brachionus plicatilis]|uniref:Uncharacterized protein n=1 Tax=Brachionus plicatilis TaxID=10195 RepID=A0A3M7QHZ2_BRAPC|nr:hypothetical protein BpHYR1_035552 [Brachionus plicatilis]
MTTENIGLNWFNIEISEIGLVHPSPLIACKYLKGSNDDDISDVDNSDIGSLFGSLIGSRSNSEVDPNEFKIIYKTSLT